MPGVRALHTSLRDIVPEKKTVERNSQALCKGLKDLVPEARALSAVSQDMVPTGSTIWIEDNGMQVG